MKKFVVTERNRTNTRRSATVEAADANEAMAKYKQLTLDWTMEHVSTDMDVHETMGSAMLGGISPDVCSEGPY